MTVGELMNVLLSVDANYEVFVVTTSHPHGILPKVEVRSPLVTVNCFTDFGYKFEARTVRLIGKELSVGEG